MSWWIFILHQQDRAYTVPGILDLLDNCDMKLQRFILGAQYLPRFSGLSRSVFRERLAQLPPSEQWAITEVFRASALMHFFIACRRERAEPSYTVDLSGPDWKTLKPLRNPGVLLLPPVPGDGSAGHLFWPPQQFPEMRRPISHAEARLFERSTGDRSIMQIVAELEESGLHITDEELVRFCQDMQDLDYLWFTSTSL